MPNEGTKFLSSFYESFNFRAAFEPEVRPWNTGDCRHSLNEISVPSDKRCVEYQVPGRQKGRKHVACCMIVVFGTVSELKV